MTAPTCTQDLSPPRVVSSAPCYRSGETPSSKGQPGPIAEGIQHTGKNLGEKFKGPAEIKSTRKNVDSSYSLFCTFIFHCFDWILCSMYEIIFTPFPDCLGYLDDLLPN